MNTFRNQNHLPRLPVFDLKVVCKRFLDLVKPLLEEMEFFETTQIVNEFLKTNGDGEKLQDALLEWSQQSEMDNWLDHFRYDGRLEYRKALPINVNYFFSCNHSKSYNDSSHTRKIAKLIYATTAFKLALDNEQIEPDYEGQQPLCMRELQRLFSYARIPMLEKDKVSSPMYSHTIEDMYAKHILVIFKAHFFLLHVITETGDIVDIEQLENDIKSIMSTELKVFQAYPVFGLLTTLDRDSWAKAYQLIVNMSDNNRLAIRDIETSLFAICLDEVNPKNIDGLAKILLHGDGCNRWFDKSIQIIVSPNGNWGVNVEHSGLHAWSVLKLIAFVNNFTFDTRRVSIAQHSKKPQLLGLTVDHHIMPYLKKAANSFDSLVASTETKVLIFKNFGRRHIRDFGISPDAFVQMAFQLSMYKTFSACFNTYESVMPRQFLHSRTSDMRVVSMDSNRFVLAMTNPGLDKASKAKSLYIAVESHVKRIKECKEGFAVRWHLFGLLMMYKRYGNSLDIRAEPTIFSSKAWKILIPQVLSTSNASSPDINLFGFGPMVDQGFGIGYLIKEDRLHFTLTSRSDKKKELEQFILHLTESLLNMEEVLMAA